MEEWRNSKGELMHKCVGYIDEMGKHHDCDMNVKGRSLHCEECQIINTSIYNHQYYNSTTKPKRLSK